MNAQTRMSLIAMIGQTISNVSLGKIGNNDAIVIEMESEALYVVESGIYASGIGIAEGMTITEVDMIPEEFVETKNR